MTEFPKLDKNSRLAKQVGEHNSRLLAMRQQARAEGNMLASLDLLFCPYLLQDGFGRRIFDFPEQKEVWEIHGRLARAYAQKRNVPMFIAMQATGHDAFMEWDAAKAERSAA